MTKQEREDRYKRIVEHFNNNNSTVRRTAKACDVSKSTVHLVLTKRKPNPTSTEILERNKKERHLRGGQATKRKYKGGNSPLF